MEKKSNRNKKSKQEIDRKDCEGFTFGSYNTGRFERNIRCSTDCAPGEHEKFIQDM